MNQAMRWPAPRKRRRRENQERSLARDLAGNTGAMFVLDGGMAGVEQPNGFLSSLAAVPRNR